MHTVLRHLCHDVSIPSFILDNVAVLKLPYSRLQDLAGIVGKVQVSDLRERNGHDGKSLFVLFSRTGTNLLRQQKPVCDINLSLSFFFF